MAIPIGTVGDRWYPRTPTRNGHIDPPNWAPRRSYDPPPRTVQRRIEEQQSDRRMRDNNPQLQPGMLVIFDRAPWRIIEIREQPDDLWPDRFEDRWKAEAGPLWAGRHARPSGLAAPASGGRAGA